VHTCPPRRDNRLVTAARIAEKYEKMIIDNPTWSIQVMKITIQEEMFVDVNDSKLKRAKSIVMQRALDATKGQYKLLCNYQLEL
jgi:alpha-galactosidase